MVRANPRIVWCESVSERFDGDALEGFDEGVLKAV